MLKNFKGVGLSVLSVMMIVCILFLPIQTFAATQPVNNGRNLYFGKNSNTEDEVLIGEEDENIQTENSQNITTESNRTVPMPNNKDTEQKNNKNNEKNKVNQNKSSWDTTVTVQTSGKYTFYVKSTNGASLYISDMSSPVISSQYRESSIEQSVSVQLTAGRVYPVRVEYYAPNSSASASLTWSGTGFNKQRLTTNDFSSNFGVNNKLPNQNNVPRINVSESSSASSASTVSLGSLTYSNVYSNSVTLTWSKLSGASASISEYIIYRDSKIIGTSSGTSYTDTGLAAGTSYSYVVKALGSYDNKIYTSSSLTVTTSNTNSSDSNNSSYKVEYFDGYVVGSTVRLYWQNVSDAVGYHIYTGAASGDYDSYYTVTGTNYTQTNPYTGSNYYVITPVYSDGSEGYISDEICIEVEVIGTASSVSGFSASANGSSVILNWDEIDNAIGYYIYSSTVSGAYSNIPLTDFPVTDTTYTDTKANAGINYYILKPIYSDNTEGDALEEISIDLAGGISITLYVGENIMTVNGVSQYVDSVEPHETAPELNEELGRVFVPISSIISTLGGETEWDSDEEKVTIFYKDIAIEMWIGNTDMALYDAETDSSEIITMDAKPYVHDVYNRTMLPIRFVMEYLNLNVVWNGTNQSIIITN